ncbi:hypothetical protein OAW23_00610 [Flavobacteriales bacterium]|nr:hypothetical protein [Flavobacteriales bacterium]
MLFKEEQYFRNSKVGKICLIVLVFLFLGVIIFDFLNQSSINGSLVIAEITTTLIPFLLIWTSKLTTRLDDEKIKYRFTPYNWRIHEIKWSQVTSYQIRKYSPLKEFGGFGYRKKLFAKTVCLNISGNIGLELKLKNGRTLLIGTQRKDKLQSFLMRLKEKNIG